MPMIEWNQIARCPACECEESQPAGALSGTEYVCRGQRIPFPDGGVPLSRCTECGLVYKSLVLSPESMLSICEELKADIWVSGYGFAEEISVIRRLTGADHFDLLDIGAAGGSLLKACSQYGGRRSAMDVTVDDRVGDSLRGEFIQGWLEDDNLTWSGERYDVVTVFDVVEHLYDAHKAFRRLRDLVKEEGVVIVETGDVETSWPVRFGIGEWWYVRRFPHNVFWSAKSLTKMAEKCGFDVIRLERKRNKNLKLLSFYSRVRMFIKSSVYRLSPRLYGWCLRRLGKAAMQPGDPLTKDHIRMALRPREGKSVSTA